MFKLLIKTKNGDKEIEVEEELYYYVRSLETTIYSMYEKATVIETKLDGMLDEDKITD